MPMYARRPHPHFFESPGASIRYSGPMPVAVQNNTPETDAALMARIGAGDQQAYTVLVDRHMTRSLNFVFRHIHDRAIAEDILQEGFLKVWQHAARWEPQAQFRTWFYKMLYNLCVDHWRKNRRPMETLDNFENTLTDNQANAEDAMIHTEQRSAVQHSLEQLPDSQRTALTLFHLHELSQYEVAQVMNLSVGAVESLLFRGRQKMKQLLSSESETQPKTTRTRIS